MPARRDALSILVSGAELALLKKLDFPCSERVLATAQPTDDGIELTGSRADFASLAGWVAGEANDARRSRRPRQTEILYSIAGQLEDVLTSYRR